MSNNHDTIARDIFQERIKKGLLGPGSDIFVDIDGHENDDNVKQALKELNKAATMVNILGSFPKAVL